jgi:superfamily II DNA or RNA helicase
VGLNRLTLTPDQDAAVQRIIIEDSGGVLVGSDLGTGKTVVAVESALVLAADGVVLVSAPLHTRYGWDDTLKRQTGYEREFRWVNTKNKAGRAALEDLKWGVPGWYFIGRELFRLQDWGGVSVDVIVHDECHTLQNRFSRGFKAAKKLMQK